MAIKTSEVNTAHAVKKPKKSGQWCRSAIQIFFFSLVALITINVILAKYGWSIPFLSTASLHAICPFGGIVSIYNFAALGTFVQKIHSSSFILMLTAILLAVFFGPVICGWICPLGTFQEWISKIGKKIFKKRFNNFIPLKLDRYLRYIRYISLILVVYFTATTARLVFQTYDPYFALFNFWSGEVAIAAYIFLGASIVLSFFTERPYCKYICPYGALLGIFNLFRIFKIRRKASTCIDCKKCDNTCPMNITVSKARTVYSHQCISCMKCTSEYSCPVAATVEFSTKGEKKA